MRREAPDCLTLVLAGGQGERLYPLTRDRAKPAVPFGGAYRIIDFTLSNCVNSGLRRIYVLTQYKSLSLESHIRRGWNLFNEALGEFIVPIPPQQRFGGSWYKGTADAIFQNIYTLERERPDRVLIVSGDHVYKMDYGRMLDFHLEREADLTVACIEVSRSRARHFGVAATDEDRRIVRWQEKPVEAACCAGDEDRCLASMGVYIFATDVLVRRVSQDAKQNTDHDFGKNVIPSMIDRDRVFAYPFADVHGSDAPYWRDIGRVDAYYAAHMDLLDPDPQFTLFDRDWPIWTIPPHATPVKLVSAGSPAKLIDSLAAPGTLIRGARVERSVLGCDVRIQPGSDVSESILMDDVEVGEGARVRRAIIDKRGKIPAGEEIGFDPARDAERFTVTEEGIVVVPREFGVWGAP
jgi:glucose-1-phosphate adenylyltransferase